MSELDVMTLLTDSNPVHVEDLERLVFPPILLRGRPRLRRAFVPAAGIVVAGAAASIVLFGSTGTRSRQPMIPSLPGLTAGAPLGSIPLADASTRLGGPVVLPETALVSPSDAEETVHVAGDRGGPVEVWVDFPGPALTVSYVRPAPQDALADYRAGVSQNDSRAKIVYLDGTPALFVPKQTDMPSWIEFAAGGTSVVVQGNYAEATLEAVAQSIIDRSAQSSANPPTLGEPVKPPTPVTDAAAADALLPFKVALPSGTKPTSMGVYDQSQQLDAYFDTPASGPYDLVEGPTTETVAMLKETARRWIVGPIHEIDVVDAVDVLLQGWSDGSLTASWIREEGGGRILTWIEGPETAEDGQVKGTFTKQQALAVAGDIIDQGG